MINLLETEYIPIDIATILDLEKQRQRKIGLVTYLLFWICVNGQIFKPTYVLEYYFKILNWYEKKTAWNNFTCKFNRSFGKMSIETKIACNRSNFFEK